MIIIVLSERKSKLKVIKNFKAKSSKEESDFDIAIIGASIAGSMAAYLLGKNGLRVALIDKCTFPRRKPCGEGLSTLGLEVLTRQGLSDWPNYVPHMPYRGFRLSAKKHSRILCSSGTSGLSVQRSLLDHFLLSRALSTGSVAPFLGAPVHTLKADGEVSVGKEQIYARHIILANGTNSALASALGSKVVRMAAPRMGISATFKGSFQVEPNLVNIFIYKHFEVYCTALANGRLNLSILAPFIHGPNLRQLILDPSLQQRVFNELNFSGELELVPLGRAPIANIRRNSFIGSTLLIGDALEEFDPIAGMGMSHALISAELAAQAIISIEQKEMDRFNAFKRYDVMRERAAKRIRYFTRFCYRLLRASHRVPSLLNLAASPVGQAVTRKFYTREVRI